jgi:hypothetical protein
LIRVLACLAAALLLVVSCASRPPSQPVDPAKLPRVDAFPGSRLVITLPPSPEPPDADAILDGRRIPTAAYRVYVQMPPDGGRTSQAWLPAPGRWSTIPAKERPRGIGPWVIVIDTPEDSQARVLEVAGKQYQVNWLPSTALLPSPRLEVSEPLLNPWRPVIEEPIASDTGLLARVLDEAASPITRWRFRLLLDGLTTLDGHPAAEPFSDPIIEAIARQNEDRWRVAIAWLWSASPELAWRFKQRLAAVADFGGVYAPAWSVDHAALDRLLEDMLSPAITPERRRDLAEAWLRTQPSGVSWILDDGGVLDNDRTSIIATVGFTNLADHATRAWVDTVTRADADFRPLPSLSTLKLLVPVPSCTGEPVLTTPLTAHVGSASAVHPVLCTRIPVQPPGLSIGPLLRDYTMHAWLAGPYAAPDLVPRAEWSTAALLHRPPPDPTVPESAVEARRWELLVECRMAPGILDVEALKREAVRIYFGPTDRPTAALRVDLTGTVTNELPPNPDIPPELIPPPQKVEIVRGADRWSFRLTLPPGAVEKDGTVRIAIVRTDALGQRSSWPRPMLPWQQQPGRAALDVRAWSGSR